MKKPLKEQKTVLLILLSNIFIVFLGVGLIVPVMPSFMNIMHLSGKTMGYLVAAFAFAQLLMSPLAGRWIDTYGRKNDRYRLSALQCIGINLWFRHTCIRSLYRQNSWRDCWCIHYACRHSLCCGHHLSRGKT